MMSFRGRHVLVTGGTGALGQAVVAALVEDGATCHVPYRDAGAVERFTLRDHARVTVYRAGDLSDPAVVTRLFAKLPDLWASVHLAGGFTSGPLRESPDGAVVAQTGANLISCVLCCRAALQTFARGGHDGRIVNVAARPALEPRSGAGMAIYTATKAAVAALTVALAEEVARDGVLVNAVAPSIMDTPENRAAMPAADFGTWPKVEEVAAAILFLASPENRVTRGAVIPVYGRS